jgi:hypothetical protein
VRKKALKNGLSTNVRIRERWTYWHPQIQYLWCDTISKVENIFGAKSVEINDNLLLTVLEIDQLSPELVDYIDKNLVTVCTGKKSSWTLEDIKTQIRQLFKNKESKEGQKFSKWEMGAIAELFTHLFMHSQDITQESMFFNLEENSVKKGFDGYYSDGPEQWIMESKSGSITTDGISHVTKLQEAFTDLENKISGKDTKNNPWREAFNHANSRDVDSADEIRKYLQQMAREFAKDIFHDSSDFNLIPCATIYFEDKAFTSKDEILKQSPKAAEKKKYKKAHLICISTRSVDTFKGYVGIKAREL